MRSNFLRIFHFYCHIRDQRPEMHQKQPGNRTLFKKVEKRVTLLPQDSSRAHPPSMSVQSEKTAQTELPAELHSLAASIRVQVPTKEQVETKLRHG